MMNVKSIKVSKVMGCPGAFGIVGEAVVIEDGNEIFLTYYNYDMEVYSVSDHSLYGYLAEDGNAPEGENLAEYESLEEAKSNSRYGTVFEMLTDLAKKVGKGI